MGDGSDRRGGPPVIRARFRLWLPEELWITTVSQSVPDATFRLLTAAPLDGRTLELGEIRHDDPQAVADAIRDHPDVLAHELLHVGTARAIVKYETRDQALFDFLGTSSLLPEFPLVVDDGVITVAITATQSQFDAFGDRLDEAGLRYELISLSHQTDDGGPLTARQRECLVVAQRLGYFAVPRECTLAEVAQELDVDTSTVSETIRRGTARVLAQFLADRSHSTAR